jgi:hypothetical protein
MSDTPRTDERAVTHPWVNGEAKYVAEELARELERENAALRADKERMDWCDKNLSGLTLLGKSMREYVDAAIDAARKETK